MRVLVTGATSLLGRHTVARLLDAGHDVVVLQRTPCGLDGVVEHLGSVTDGDVVDTAMAGVDGVIHLAAKVDPVGDWADFEAINVEGTATVHAAARVGVSRFVYVSSPSVTHDGSSISGDGAAPADPERAHGHYSVSKAMAERALLAASDDTMPVVAVRPHLVIGPGDTQLVGRIVDRARKGRMPLVGRAALVDTTWVDNAAARCSLRSMPSPESAVGRSSCRMANLVPSTSDRPDHCRCGGRLVASCSARPGRHAGGAAAEAVWERSGRDGEPPMTAFGAEQLSTAHWFDQRDSHCVGLGARGQPR